MIKFMAARMLAMGITSIFMAIVIGIILYLPRPLPGVTEDFSKPEQELEGLVAKKYWVGVLKEELNYVQGLPQGEALQYYPNRSLLRELKYEQGKLHGVIKEYYEKEGFRPMSMKYRLSGLLAPSMRVRGDIKALWHYEQGKKHGPYQSFYKGGGLKEEGDYLEGKKHGVFKKYAEIGTLKSEKFYLNGKKVKQGDLEPNLI